MLLKKKHLVFANIVSYKNGHLHAYESLNHTFPKLEILAFCSENYKTGNYLFKG